MFSSPPSTRTSGSSRRSSRRTSAVFEDGVRAGDLHLPARDRPPALARHPHRHQRLAGAHAARGEVGRAALSSIPSSVRQGRGGRPLLHRRGDARTGLDGQRRARPPRHRPRRVRAALGLHRRRRHRRRHAAHLRHQPARSPARPPSGTPSGSPRDEVLSESSDKTRRAIILLSDGVDTSSQLKMSEAIDARHQGRRHHLLHRHRRQLLRRRRSRLAAQDLGAHGRARLLPARRGRPALGLRADSGGAALAVPRRLLAHQQGEGRHVPQGADRGRQPRIAPPESPPHLPAGLLRPNRRVTPARP